MKNTTYTHFLFLFCLLIFSFNCYAKAWESSDEAKLFKKGDLKGVKELLATKNYLSDSPEFISEAYREAISSGNLDLIKYLEGRGWLKYCRSNKCWLVINASVVNKAHILRYFLAKGFDVNETDNFGTALHYAVLNFHYESIKILVESGIDINKKNIHKETALELAIKLRKKYLENKPTGTAEKVITHLRSKGGHELKRNTENQVTSNKTNKNNNTNKSFISKLLDKIRSILD